jgi:antitoxin ParD1/3/4
MATVEKVSIALTRDMAALVRQVVESGEYASSSEVVRDALRDWKTKRELRGRQIEDLRRLWHEGIESGPGRFESMEALLAEARCRHESRE